MTLLNIDTAGAIAIDLEATIGEKIAILGVAGTGKTNSAAVIIEEFLAARLPMTILDIEGEYWGLKEKYPIIIIGRSANVDIEVDASNAAQFATYSVEHGVSMILDLADYESLEEMNEFVLAYFEALWTAVSKARRPYVVVLEEAHEFIPQGANTPVKKLLTTFALRGRKRGVSMIVISQRSAKVEKSVLTQATFVFLHKVVHPTDIKVYQEILPLPGRVVEERVGQLAKGDALVLVNHNVTTAHIRRRHTYHAGATPQLDDSHRKSIQRADDSLLADLRKLLTAPPPEADNQGALEAELQKLRGLLSQREGTITAQKAEITRLNQRLDAQGAELERWRNALATKPVIVPTNNVAPQPTRVAPSPAPARKPEFVPSPGTVARSAESVQREQRRWQKTLSDLKQLPKWKREVLVFLLEREGNKYTVAQMASSLHYNQSTISNNPPLDMIRAGWIAREGIPGQFLYFSTSRVKLAKTFEFLQTDNLIADLLRKLV